MRPVILNGGTLTMASSGTLAMRSSGVGSTSASATAKRMVARLIWAYSRSLDDRAHAEVLEDDVVEDQEALRPGR